MKINPMCDLLVGNRPENDSDTQYYECENCHRYEICKNYGCLEMCSPKEIKEATPNILEPSYDLLKQEGYFEMSMISEQVKRLREIAKNFNEWEYNRFYDAIFEAADTIEALSAKLAVANMERSDRYYGANRKLKAGDIVQHFKRETAKDREHSMEYLYVIEAISTHTETGEKLVVYRALYKNDENGVNFNVFARPYDMFISEVDHEKYPDIKQKYRFELFEHDRS